MKPCHSLVSVAAAAAVLLGMVSDAAAEKGQGGKYWVFLGTSGNGSRGVYRFELDTATGEPSGLELAGEASNPGFLALHPSGKFLYAVGNIALPRGKTTGGLTAFALDRTSGKLTKLNTQSSGGSGPC